MDDELQDEQEILEEWEKYMSDFVPEDMQSMVVPGNGKGVTDVFFEVSYAVPT